MAIPAYSTSLLIFIHVFVVMNFQGAIGDNGGLQSGYATFYTGPITTKGMLLRWQKHYSNLIFSVFIKMM